MNSFKIIVNLSIAAIFAASAAHAENKYWQVESGSWFDVGNWNPSTPASPGDNFYIDNGGTAKVDSDSGFTASKVWVGFDNTGYWQIDGLGTISLSYFKVGVNAGSYGEVTVNNGTLQWDGENTIIGQSGKGLLTINGGLVHFTGGYTIYAGYYAGSEGRIVLNGGEFRASRSDSVVNMVIGQQGYGEFIANNDAKINCGAYVYVGGSQYAGGGTGKLILNDTSSASISLLLVGASLGHNVYSHGTIEFNGNSTAVIDRLYVGYETANVGKMVINDNATVTASTNISFSNNGKSDVEMNGGTFNANATSYFAYQAGSKSDFVMNGGTYNSPNKNVYLGYGGAASLEINDGNFFANNLYLGNNSSSSGDVSLNGGVLEVLAVYKGSGSASLSFDGGTLRAKAGAASDFIYNIASISVARGGATIDTNSNDIKISSAFVGEGAVTIIGEGFLTLTGASSNTGGFFIENAIVMAQSEKALGNGTTVIHTNGYLNSIVESVKTGGLHLAGGALDNMGYDQVGSYTVSNFIMDSGLYYLTIRSASEFDQIISNGGSFALNSGVIELCDFGIDYDLTYQIFEGFDYGYVNEYPGYITGYDTENYIAHISTDGVLWFEVIPEPSTYGALFGAFVLLFVLRRRIKK